MAQSFHPCSTTLPRCVCPAPPPQLHPRSSQTPLIPPPPALGCCRTSLPPDPEVGKEGKKDRGQGRWERERQEMWIIVILQTVSGLYFLDQWRRVNGGVNDAYSATYLRQFQSHGRNCGAVGTSTSQFVTSGMELPPQSVGTVVQAGSSILDGNCFTPRPHM